MDLISKSEPKLKDSIMQALKQVEKRQVRPHVEVMKELRRKYQKSVRR